jgi:nucleoside-diphosphate-sugar epimerase
MKKIIVTGGNGFIGSHLLKLLIDKKYDVEITSRSMTNKFDNKIKNVDLENYDYHKKSITKDKDIIFHLANNVNVADMIKNPKKHFLNNIKSTLNILEDIRINNPKCLIILASSDKVYGNINKKLVSEKDITTPVEPYGSSKLCSEMLINMYHKNYNLKYIILRFGNTFGEDQQSKLFIPSVIKQLLKGGKTLTVGNLEVYRNFIYIKDVINVFLNCINNKKVINQIINISSYNVKINLLLKEIIKLNEKLTGNKIKIVQNKKLFRTSEKKSKRFILNTKKAKDLLKWTPKYHFKEAIEKTFKSYLK